MRSIIRLYSVLVLLAIIAIDARAQYSTDVFSLKKSQDLYDERGYQQGGALAVDGQLVISEANGNVSYTYPISRFSVNGYQVATELNYCGSVAFTAFNKYHLAHDNPGGTVTPYAGWSRFHQNRPAWILGVNGFAIQVLSTASHFHADPNSDMKFANIEEFDDGDMIWAIDGYDFCNRMIDFGAVGASELIGNTYVDNIRLLRSDGSVLELANVNQVTNTQVDQRPEVYTGYYLPMEANGRGFALVEFDSTYWPEYITNALTGIPDAERRPMIPRTVRYYPGDGLEYRFREWVIPYGMPAYTTYDSLAGGKYAGPTIFYLEEINGASGALVQFDRSRHYPVHPSFNSGMRFDSTRGRALALSFAGHTISYGVNSLMVQAFGRTTQVKFGKVLPSGNAAETTWMPIGSNGYVMDNVRGMAGWGETEANLYKSYLGYVTEIIDPEGRSTKFEYEPYRRQYVGFGFPHAGSDVTLSLNNLRLKEVTEPAARYTLSYFYRPYDLSYGNVEALYVAAGGDTMTVEHNDPGGSHTDMTKLTNVAAVLRKYDRSNTLLTTERFRFVYQPGSTFASASTRTLIDNISGDTSSVERLYRRFTLPNLAPLLPPPQYTVPWETTVTAKGEVTTTTTYFSSSTTAAQLAAWGSQYPISTPKWGTPFVILDTAVKTVVNGLEKSYTTSEYTIDTVRGYGASGLLAGLFGQDITRKVTTVRRPGSHAPLLSTTVDYLHLPMVDTTATVISALPQKFIMYRRHDSLFRLGEAPERMSWEEMERDPRIASYNYDTVVTRALIPPFALLEEQNIVRDSSNNILGGGSAIYHTTIDPASSLSWANRGLKLRDSVIGTGGTVRLPGGVYQYDMRRLVGAGNANGGRTAIAYYDYLLPGDPVVPFAGTYGALLDNRGQAVPYALRGAAYGNFTEQPVGERQYVRRYSTAGALDTAALTAYYERSFYGLVSGRVDANGIYSRQAYDKNGRLKMQWLPGDFQNPDSLHLENLYGLDSSEAYGSTNYNVNFRWVICDPNRTPYPTDSLTSQTHYGALYADKPALLVPECPECDKAEGKGGGRTIQADCGAPRAYIERTPAIGSLSFAAVPPGAASIVSLDSAWLRLYITSVLGECVNFEVDIPALGVTRTYVLNCSSTTGGGSGGNGNETRKRDRGQTIQGVGGEGGYFLKVDLTSVKDSLLDYLSGQQFGVSLKVTTAGGRVECVSGYDASDKRPQLMLKGTFSRVNHLADYTISYTYDDDALAATISAKVDDSLTTANLLDSAALAGYSRRSAIRHYAGADGRLLRSEGTVREDNGTVRVDTVRHRYTGAGRRTMTKDPLGDSVVTRYDGLGRPLEVINADGTRSTVSYRYAAPAALGVADQDFYGWALAATTTNENGVRFTKYTDAFGRVRREVADTAGLRLVTRYEYDLLGRLCSVVSPKGDTTRYAYDQFGRVRHKHHPDLGTATYAYDQAGNVRFIQSEEQAARGLMIFNQYDDLNRVTLVGEAVFGSTYHDEDTVLVPEEDKDGGSSFVFPPAGRIATMLDPTRLHTGNVTSILTANKTLWMAPQVAVPVVPPAFGFANCQLLPELKLGETAAPVGPFIRRPVGYWLSNPGLAPADTGSFEHVALHPEFIRIAIAHDTMPHEQGAIWGTFPTAAQWDALAPHGKVRFQKGREAAVAYREQGCEPFHYAVMSYDERGRLEALLRWTENIGFDAVYYTYNAMNQVTSVRAADFIRQHTTWYGYDPNGRVDSVWSYMTGAGGGLSGFFGIKYPNPSERPDTADIVYRYTKTGQIDTMLYPPADLLVRYAYNRRKWLDTMIARRDGSLLFFQALRYDSTGQIVAQSWQHGAGGVREEQTYAYDSVQRLTGWTQGEEGKTPTGSTGYSYDEVGNRLAVTKGSVSAEGYTYTAGKNQLEAHTDAVSFGLPVRTEFAYNRNGSALQRVEQGDLGTAWTWRKTEQFGYSFRELIKRYMRWTPGPMNTVVKEDWRYRYSAGSEREQKRMYPAQWGDTDVVYPWVYYLLGGDRKQLAVYHGQQVVNLYCPLDTGRRVYFYPAEYLTYGAGGTASVLTRPDAVRQNGVKEYVIADHLGSSRVRLDDTGGVTGGNAYEPFGTPLAVTGDAPRKGYIDREQDLESGEYSLGVRGFDAKLGRFLSVDALWERYRPLTPYQYGANRPLTLIDPSGLKLNFLKEGNEGVVKDKSLENTFISSLRFLEEKGVEEAKQLRYLYESEEFTIDVFAVDDVLHSRFFRSDPDNDDKPTLYWAPYSGLEYEALNEDLDWVTQRISPIIVLVHEGNHAYRFFTDPENFNKDAQIDVYNPYKSMNEQLATEAEFSAGKTLGQLQYIRPDHENYSRTFKVRKWTLNVPLPTYGE